MHEYAVRDAEKRGEQNALERYRNRVIQNMKRKAQELGFEVVQILGPQQETATAYIQPVTMELLGRCRRI